MLISCPHCRGEMEHDGSLAGQTVACPHCQGAFKIVDPPGSSPPSPPPAVSSVVTRSAFRDELQHRFKPATNWLDIFDWRFEKYLTPWIVRITWIACLAVACLALIIQSVIFVMSFAPDITIPSHATPPGTHSEFRVPLSSSQLSATALARVAWYVVSGCASLIAILWIRVLLEIAIVAFNIANSLASIDNKTRAPPR